MQRGLVRSASPIRLVLVSFVSAVLVGAMAVLSACGDDDAGGSGALAPTAEGQLRGLDIDLHFAEG
jgi:Na+/serine symporter